MKSQSFRGFPRKMHKLARTSGVCGLIIQNFETLLIPLRVLIGSAIFGAKTPLCDPIW